MASYLGRTALAYAMLLLAAFVPVGCTNDEDVSADVPDGGTTDGATSDATTDAADAADAEADATDRPPMRVLFVGNSYTYGNDLPGVVRALGAATPGAAMEVDSVTKGSAALSSHWEEGVARARIESGGFDAVVLQGKSDEAAYGKDWFYTYARLFAEASRDAGARPVWYATWAPNWQTAPHFRTRTIDHAYRTAAEEWGGTVARVGRAWLLALAEQPIVETYDADGEHPSPAGTLLAACTLFLAITGKKAVVPDPVPLGIDRATATALCALAPRVHCGPEGCGCETAKGVTTTYTALSALAPACDGTTERSGLYCNAAMNAACSATSCMGGGFGPVSSTPGDAVDLTCVAGSAHHTTFAELQTFDPLCDGSTERNGPHCAAAIDAACGATGALSGFGPTAIAGEDVTVTCVSPTNAQRQRAHYNALRGYDSRCDGVTEQWGPACNTAVNRYCLGSGFAGGFGPVGTSLAAAAPSAMMPLGPVMGPYADFVCVSW